jgi:non-ribosomal peptide synthetase component F
MKRFSPTLYLLRATLAEYFELFMTTVGVLIAILVTLSELTRGEMGMALTFLIWLQGLLLWAVHRHCVLRTRALIQKMRLMMQDRVNNRLTVWLNLTDVQARLAAEAGREEREAVSLGAARAVSLELEKLSFESLRSWERRHARFLGSQMKL